MQSFPPKVPLDYMSPPAPIDPGYGKFDRSNYFQTYRNEFISRIQMPRSEKYSKECTYTPIPNIVSTKYLKMPEPLFSMIDHGRHEEVDNFYILSQLHRDQYKDRTNSLHPLDYFKVSEYQYQCPIDPTTQYMKCPKYYMKYRQPIVLPLTAERDIPMPYLPHRVLTGVYNKSSDISYKR